MKKIFVFMLLCVAIFTGCSKDEFPDSPNSKPTTQKTYTVTVNMGLVELDAEYNTRSTLNVTFFEYNDDNEMVNYQTRYNVKDNEVIKLTANKLSTKMVVYLEMDSVSLKTGSTGEFNRYVAQVFYLENNMHITINGNTRVSEYHPLK